MPAPVPSVASRSRCCCAAIASGTRLSGTLLFAELVTRSRDADELAQAVELCSAWVFGYVDAAVTLGEEFYSVERERWLRSTAASRDEAIDAILAGRQRDPWWRRNGFATSWSATTSASSPGSRRRL